MGFATTPSEARGTHAGGWPIQRRRWDLLQPRAKRGDRRWDLLQPRAKRGEPTQEVGQSRGDGGICYSPERSEGNPRRRLANPEATVGFATAPSEARGTHAGGWPIQRRRWDLLQPRAKRGEPTQEVGQSRGDGGICYSPERSEGNPRRRLANPEATVGFATAPSEARGTHAGGWPIQRRRWDLLQPRAKRGEPTQEVGQSRGDGGICYSPERSEGNPRRRLANPEATVGFEPTNEGFADPCLTTWLRRRRGSVSVRRLALSQEAHAAGLLIADG